MKWERIRDGLRRAPVPGTQYMCHVVIAVIEPTDGGRSSIEATPVIGWAYNDGTAFEEIDSGLTGDSIEEAQADATEMMCEHLAKQLDEKDVDYDVILAKAQRLVSKVHNLEQNLAMMKARADSHMVTIRELRQENSKLKALSGIRKRLSAAVHAFVRDIEE